MGVPGLWEAIGGGFEERVPFDVFATRFLQKHQRTLRISIDGYGWIVEILSNSSVQNASNNYVSHCVLLFMSRVKYLMKLYVSFVIIFDGKHKPKLKRNFEGCNQSRGSSKSVSRASSHKDYQTEFDVFRDLNYSRLPEEETDYVETYSNMVRLLHENPEMKLEDSLDLSSDFAKIIKEIKLQLSLWNISYVDSPAEGEAECAHLQLAGVVDYTMSNDVDCLIFGATKMLRNFSRFIEDNPASTVRNLHEESSRWITPVHMEKVTAVTGFDRWRMLLFALLSGSDYGTGVKNMGFKRAAAISLLGSPMMKLYNEKQKKSKKKNTKLEEMFLEEEERALEKEDENEKIPDFAMLLKGIYTLRENVLHYDLRIGRLEEFKEQLKDLVVNKSYKVFERKLSNNTFTDSSSALNELEGFPPDKVILLFFYPIVNKTNIFKFMNGMTNYTDLNEDYVPHDVDPNALDWLLAPRAFSTTDQSVEKVKIRRVSGVTNQYPYVTCETTYKLILLSKRWKIESLEYKLPEIEYSKYLWSKRVKIPQFLAMYINMLKTDSFFNIGRTISPRQWLVRELDQCYLIHFLKQNQEEYNKDKKKEIFLDKLKTLRYPLRRKNLAHCEANGISFLIALVRITYNKNQFFHEIIEEVDNLVSDPDCYDASFNKDTYVATQSASESENGLSSESENNNEDYDNDDIEAEKPTRKKIKNRRNPDWISCWVPRDIVHYYVPEIVENFERQERERELAKEQSTRKRKPKTAKKSRSYTQKTKLDQFFKPIDKLGSSSKQGNEPNKKPTKEDADDSDTERVHKKSSSPNELKRIGSVSSKKTASRLSLITQFFKPVKDDAEPKTVSSTKDGKKNVATIVTAKTTDADNGDATIIKLSDNEDTTMVGEFLESLIFLSQKDKKVNVDLEEEKGAVVPISFIKTDKSLTSVDNRSSQEERAIEGEENNDEDEDLRRLENVITSMTTPFGEVSSCFGFSGFGDSDELDDDADNDDDGDSKETMAKLGQPGIEGKSDKRENSIDVGSDLSNEVLVKRKKSVVITKPSSIETKAENDTESDTPPDSSADDTQKNVFGDKVTLPPPKRNKGIRKTNSTYSKELGWSEDEFTDEGFSSDLSEFEQLMGRISPTKRQKKNQEEEASQVVDTWTPCKSDRIVNIEYEIYTVTPLKSASERKRQAVLLVDEEEDSESDISFADEIGEKPHYARKIVFSDLVELTPRKSGKKCISAGDAILKSLMEPDDLNSE